MESACHLCLKKSECPDLPVLSAKLPPSVSTETDDVGQAKKKTVHHFLRKRKGNTKLSRMCAEKINNDLAELVHTMMSSQQNRESRKELRYE
ncbi:hypothetical protein RRG08_058018 [Elysia crispata]|uniref:Uncharacterized protein n=1 Tax=Elysia crispata TaxID=231223 RepID=A0AAE1AQV0_9GAST|nr:hypothetical protein RRG08_058018 [Elysia crispata]